MKVNDKIDWHHSESVAMAVEMLNSDRERPRNMSSAAIRCAKEHYGVEHLAVQFDRLYQELLA